MEILKARLEDAIGPHMDGILDSVRQLVENAASLDEVAGRIDELFPDASDEEIAEIMRQAFVIAELQGRIDVMEE